MSDPIDGLRTTPAPGLSAEPSAREPAIRPALAPGAAPDPERARVEAAAEKFEAYFVAQLLRQMRSSSRAFAADGDARRDRVSDDLLDTADVMVADSLARTRAFGIADLLVRQLLPPAPPAASATTPESTSPRKP